MCMCGRMKGNSPNSTVSDNAAELDKLNMCSV